MGVMSDEDRMDALLRQLAAEEYNRPPEIVPREQMWEAIRQGSGKREAGSGETAGTGNGEQGTVSLGRDAGDPSLRAGWHRAVIAAARSKRQ
jgi:hypothetical protein